MNTLEEVLMEWQNNPHFKQTFKQNPEKALSEAQLVLNAADLAKVKVMLVEQENGGKDGELDKRINK